MAQDLATDGFAHWIEFKARKADLLWSARCALGSTSFKRRSQYGACVGSWTSFTSDRLAIRTSSGAGSVFLTRSTRLANKECILALDARFVA
jgi:hypothetical protein